MSSDKDSLKQITVLRSDESFGGDPDMIYGSGGGKKKKRKKKKQAAALKPLEKATFKLAKRYDDATKTYKERHSKSNKKKKNGWLKDLPKNYSKSMSKLMKF